MSRIKHLLLSLLFVPALALLTVGLLVPARRARSAPREVRLSVTEQRKLNTFFSNFSEARVEPFKRGGPSNKALIRFCLWHHGLNATGRIEMNKDYSKWRLAARHVDETALKFFGRRVAHHEAPDAQFPYRSGYYYNMLFGEGDPVPFSQLGKLYAVGGNEYRAEVNVFEPPSGAWDGDVHAAPSSWLDWEGMGPPKRTARLRATIRKIMSGSNTRYILLEYQQSKR